MLEWKITNNNKFKRKWCWKLWNARQQTLKNCWGSSTQKPFCPTVNYGYRTFPKKVFSVKSSESVAMPLCYIMSMDVTNNHRRLDLNRVSCKVKQRLQDLTNVLYNSYHQNTLATLATDSTEKICTNVFTLGNVILILLAFRFYR